jgi:hypothetical protein
MWARIIGAVLILSGAACMASPERLRRRLQRKTQRAIRRYAFVAAGCLGLLLASAGWQHEGMLARALVVAGVIVLAKGFFLLRAKSADVIMAWLIALPAVYYRMFAVGQMLLGLSIILRLK